MIFISAYKEDFLMEISVEKLDFSNIDERLRHLTNDSVVELIKKYYDGIKVSELLVEYKINVNPSQLYTLFPPLKLENKCKICNSPSIYYFESKTAYSYSNFSDKINTTDIECGVCGHKENNRFCKCEYCISERKRIRDEEEEKQKKRQARKKKEIDRLYSEDKWEKVSEIDLCLEDRLYLAVLMRASLSEVGTYIEALENKIDILAPTDNFRASIVRTLSRKNILIPHTNSNLDLFEVLEDRVGYYIYGVNYRINIKPVDNNYEEMIKRLMYPDSNLFEDDKDFCFQMWKKIALHECLEYLLYKMDKVGYSFNPGEKTINVFEHLLENFSVAQIYNIIYRAIAYSTVRYQANEITKFHAQNLVISSCEKQGERAIADKWNLKPYTRIKDLPQTMVSEIFFTSILKISELGFMEKPTRDL